MTLPAGMPPVPQPPDPGPGAQNHELVWPPVPPRSRHSLLASLSLRTRMVFLIVALLVVGLAISTVAATTMLKNNLLNELDRQLIATARTAGNSSLPNSSSYFFSAGALPSDYFFMLRDARGATIRAEVQTATFNKWGQPQIPELSQETVAERAGKPFTVAGTALVPQQARASASSWRVAVYPLRDPFGEYNGSFIVALPLAGVTGTTDELAKILLTSCLAILILGGLAGYIGVRRTLRPLHTIEGTAKAIAAGDLSQRVPAMPTTTEVGSLADSLNVMLGRIEQSFDAQARSETRMRQFVSDASHELRTPLVTIRGYSELFRMGGITSPEQIAESMARIEGSAIQMGGLVENLLALARLDETTPMRTDDVDLRAIARDSLADLNAIDPSRPTNLLQLTPDGGPSASDTPDGDTAPDDASVPPCVVVGDEALLRQVLTNLIGNIVQHTAPGTAVDIAVGREGNPDTPADDVIVAVRDHGPGIPAEHQERVFERFHRVDASRSSASGGSGLGLAIVASIVSAHRGRVRVQDTPGGGATIRLSIPAAPSSRDASA